MSVQITERTAKFSEKRRADLGIQDPEAQCALHQEIIQRGHFYAKKRQECGH